MIISNPFVENYNIYTSLIITCIIYSIISVVRNEFDECTGHILIDDLNFWHMLFVLF